MTRRVSFVDTNVLLEILEVPGLCADPSGFQQELKRRLASGERFVLPIATIVETGNHISQSSGDRHATAKRFDDLLRAAVQVGAPFAVDGGSWDETFLQRILDGATTGEPFVKVVGDGRFGTGDLSILAERDRFVERSNFSRSEVGIWTIEAELQAFA